MIFAPVVILSLSPTKRSLLAAIQLFTLSLGIFLIIFSYCSSHLLAKSSIVSKLNSFNNLYSSSEMSSKAIIGNFLTSSFSLYSSFRSLFLSSVIFYLLQNDEGIKHISLLHLFISQISILLTIITKLMISSFHK